MAKTVMARPVIAQKGMAVVRAALCTAAAQKAGAHPSELALERFGPSVERLVKAAVPAGRYADVGGDERSVAEFFDAVRERSAIGRMRMRRVPMRVRTMFASESITAAWVRPGQAVPAGRTIWDERTLEPHHVAALSVVTEETINAAMGGDPRAEEAVRRDMVAAVADAVDAALLDPTNAGEAERVPASITYGVDPMTAGDDPLADLKGMIEGFTGDLSSASFVMRPGVAAALAGRDFPNLGVNGGSLWDLPVVTTRKAPAAAIVLADGDGLALAEGDVGIRASGQASIEMASDPTMTAESPPTETTVVSLWQTRSVGFIADVAMNWATVRPGAVAMLNGIGWRPFVT